jgi:uncharacterized damage-inducible protein DinB
MSVDYLISNWKDVRNGFIDEINQIPADQFTFRATPDTRTITELLHHVIESQKMLVGECTRPEPNLMRQSFADHIKEYAPEVSGVTEKNGLVELMRTSMDVAEADIRSNADMMDQTMRRFDGQEITRLQFLQFASAHEMYHRGQLTVYARLLNIEPVLTQRMKKLFSQKSAGDG